MTSSHVLDESRLLGPSTSNMLLEPAGKNHENQIWGEFPGRTAHRHEKNVAKSWVTPLWKGDDPAMPIDFVSGDIFDNVHNAQALAHGCNCQGSMGAGIAKGLRARYPEMFEEYRKRCKAEPRQFNLGDCWLWKADKQAWVFNLATQEGFWHARASYEAIETALRSMRKQADAEGITRIAVPRIGVGYGGLSWKKVRVIIEAVFADWPGTLVVYEEYVAGDSAQAVAAPAEVESRVHGKRARALLRKVARSPVHARRGRRRLVSNRRNMRQTKRSTSTK